MKHPKYKGLLAVLLLLSAVLMAGCGKYGRFKVCFNNRLYYDMSQQEAQEVLGDPSGEWNEAGSRILIYDLDYEGFPAEADLWFRQNGRNWELCNVELFVYCDADRRQYVMDCLKDQVCDTYSYHPNFSWTTVSSDVADTWMFGLEQGATGLVGYAISGGDSVQYTCGSAGYGSNFMDIN